MKKCTKCGEVKGRDQFTRRSAAKDGLSSSCRLCERAQQQARRVAHGSIPHAERAARKMLEIQHGAKTCIRCHEAKPPNQFLRDHRQPGGLASRCRVCESIRNAIRNSEPARREHRLQVNREWRASSERFKQWSRARKRHGCAVLSDEYVKCKLVEKLGCSARDVPQPLIEAQRAVLKLKRLLKEKVKT